ITMVAPSLASPSAVSLPMPVFAPVTMQTFPTIELFVHPFGVKRSAFGVWRSDFNGSGFSSALICVICGSSFLELLQIHPQITQIAQMIKGASYSERLNF